MRLRGLRPRLVLTFALVAAVASVALAATSYFLVRAAVLDRASTAAVARGRAILEQAVSRLPPGASAAEARAALSRLPDLGGAALVAVGEDGSSETTSLSLSADSVPDGLRAGVAAGDVVWLRTGSGAGDHVVVGGRVPDGPSLFLFFPLAAEVSDLESLRDVLGGVGACLVLLSAGVGVVAARGLLRPLRGARVAAQRIEVGLLGTRLPQDGSDEFADLARAFNRMADALQRTVADLEALEASQRRFVSDVSHELRTPLTALRTAADVLDDNTAGLNDPGRRAARLLVVESRRLGAMVEDLMEISRFDAGVRSMAWEQVDVGALVAGALSARGWTDRVDVDLDVASRLTTWADPRRLDAVVGNLVGNALDHGSAPVRVVVSGGGAASVRIVVSDAGPGVSPADLAHVFDRFWKADPARTGKGGSGLGLAIARENARLHGGDITASSEAGRGATFTFVLPLRSGPPDAAAVAEPLPDREEPVTTARHDALIGSRRRRRR